MRALRRLFKNKKGIDTILAALLMVVIVVVASVMVYAWSTGLLGSLLVTPNVGKEAMNLENSSFASNGTQVTLYLRNTGSAAVALNTYYVKDPSSNQWSKTSWSGPSIQPNGLGTVVINIGTACCTYSGTSGAFNTFNAGSSYNFVIITTRNNQFTFQAIR